MYYFSVHLLYASIVGTAAWVLTTIPGASATTKYWIWVVTALNFIVPTGAIIDKLWAPDLRWATPLSVIGGPLFHTKNGRSRAVHPALANDCTLWDDIAVVSPTASMRSDDVIYRDAKT